MNRSLSVLGCILAAILVIATLYATEPRTPVAVTSSVLGGADRYMTYLSTDKPIYRPGETMYVRGVVLHHKSRKPLPTNINLQAAFNIKAPKAIRWLLAG